ncbi:MAG: DNA-processing protein DprA [Acidimicrobiales bacterium]
MSAELFAAATLAADSELPGAAWLTALASLPGAGPRRLQLLLAQRDPLAAWALVLAGGNRALCHELGSKGQQLLDSWARAAHQLDVGELWERSIQMGIGAVAVNSPAFPEQFRDDPEPPAVLFHRGNLDVLAGPRVAIIGTRKCTRYGYDIANEFARDLAVAGVAVVSGLALGIDAAAHHGAVGAGAAPPIAVVANGLDSVYPRSNRVLWEHVVQAGVVLSEAPLDTEPERWRFPARNRIIAALSDIVVVVESHARGGSLHTVAEAERRNVPVMAVPGPIHSAAAEGTNSLLRDGCAPACSVDDILLELGLVGGCRRSSSETRPLPNAISQQVLEAIGWQPATADQLLARACCSVAELASAVENLANTGWISNTDGWFERVGRPESLSPSNAESGYLG